MGERFPQRHLHGLLGVAVLVVIGLFVFERRPQRLDPAVNQLANPSQRDAQLISDFVPPARNGAHQRIAIDTAHGNIAGSKLCEQIAPQRHEALVLRQVRKFRCGR